MVVPEKKVNEKPPPSQKSQQPILAKKQTTNLLTIRGFLELRMLSFLFGFFFFNFYFTLQYCIGFAIHWHESTTGVHVFPNMNPPPTSLRITSLWIIPMHQPQASCIEHRLALRFLHDSIHVSMPFSQIIPPSSSPSESKILNLNFFSLPIYQFRWAVERDHKLIYFLQVKWRHWRN